MRYFVGISILLLIVSITSNSQEYNKSNIEETFSLGLPGSRPVITGTTSNEAETSSSGLPGSRPVITGTTPNEAETSSSGLPGSRPVITGTTPNEAETSSSGLPGSRPVITGTQFVNTIPSKGSSITYYTPSWYTPTYGDPILIRKQIIPVDSKKDYVTGDKLRVYVEVTNLKNDNKNSELNNIYICELVDDELQIVPADGNPISKKSFFDFTIPYSLDDLSRSKLKFFRGESMNYKTKPIKWGEDGMLKDQIVCSNEAMDYPLFDWVGLMRNNSSEKGKLIKCLNEIFDVKWANNSSEMIVIPKRGLDGKNISLIYINHTNHAKENDYARLQIDDIDNLKNEGGLGLDISGDRNYDLKYRVGNNGSIIVYDWNNILKLDINELGSKEKLIYTYYIKPKRSGLFSIESVARIGDSTYLAWPDIVYPLMLDIGEPNLNFEVVPLIEKDHVYPNAWRLFFDEGLTLKYEISLAGDTLKQYSDRIAINLDDPSGGSYFVDEYGNPTNNTTFIRDFSGTSKTHTIIKDLRYNYPGLYSLPGVKIEGKHYLFKDIKITVEDPWQSIFDKIITFNTLIIIIAGFLASKQIKGSIVYLRRRLWGTGVQGIEAHELGEEEEIKEEIAKFIGIWSDSYREITKIKEEIKKLKQKDLGTNDLQKRL
jgi:hypothetical protein